MKELKEYFSGKGQVKGYVFNQISKTKHAYLYEVKGDNTKHYEVFKRRVNTLYECVSYPSNKAFGVWAFTLMDLDSAYNKFNEINTNELLKESLNYG